MKVFWSWQSDTPGKTGRFFVRDAIAAAIEKLKTQIEVVEPERDPEPELHLDHDRKGIPGSPDLARVILDKIENSAVFVADVTAVGAVLADGPRRTGSPKKLINSNVAIELGYALHALSDRALIMVANEHYGTRDDLPFDLKQKSGPILFRLAPDADASSIKSALTALEATLFEALKLCLEASREEIRRRTKFSEAEFVWSPSQFFPLNEVLASAGPPGEQEFRVAETVGQRAAYIRIFPTFDCPPVGRNRMSKIFDARKPCPMSMTIGGIPAKNRFGAITFDFEGRTTINALTQGFPTGELWGVNSTIFGLHNFQQEGQKGAALRVVLPMISFEKLYVRVLTNYVKVASELALPLPYTVELGVTGLDDAYLAVPGGPFNKGEAHPVRSRQFSHRYQLVSNEDSKVMEILRKFFEEIYDLAALSRSEVLTEQLVAAHSLPELHASPKARLDPPLTSPG